MLHDAPNLNQFWADLIVEELIRNGIHQFFVAPGSRSTPLAVAIHRNPQAEARLHYDERGLAFAALGYARATGKPAAWVTTSGTAVANGLPAVVEASNDRVPMLLLTADRPPEVRDTDANQTIIQPHIFGDYVRWQFDMPAPTEALRPDFLLSTVDHAISRSLSQSGPVHLNLQFREPLAPDATDFDAARWLQNLNPWYESGEAFESFCWAYPQITGIENLLESTVRGLVVVGKLDPHQVADAEAWLTHLSALGWPILADIGSQLRSFHHPQVMAYFDQILLSGAFKADFMPDTVLQLGSRMTSKRLLEWLGKVRPARYVLIKGHPFRSDPNHQVTMSIETNLAAFVTHLSPDVPQPMRDPSWLSAWQSANAVVTSVLEQQPEALREPLLVRALLEETPASHGVFWGNSMAIRDADMYAPPIGRDVRMAANRGASGIDGLVGTATGFAAGLSAPVTMLLGDLSLIHDLNSLLMVRQSAQPILVVVVNNDGGGIFSFLPIARHQDVFEPYFGTPHGLAFSAAAALFRLPYFAPTSLSEFRQRYVQALASGESALIEIRTNREENWHFHQQLQQSIRQELDAAVQEKRL